jgi:hypothetical protein
MFHSDAGSQNACDYFSMTVIHQEIKMVIHGQVMDLCSERMEFSDFRLEEWRLPCCRAQEAEHCP